MHNKPKRLPDQPSTGLVPDTAAVRAAMEGDGEAFAVLFNETYRRMYALVRQYLRNDADIRDALQIGYTKAWKYIGHLDPPENFLPWLRRIMENAAKDVLRDVCENAVCDPDAALPAPDDTEARERVADIRDALAMLDEQQRRLLVLYYYDGLKLREIASSLGMPLSTAHHRLGQARRRLLDVLKERGIDGTLYGRGPAGIVATLLCEAIGTSLLSVSAAQEVLEQVLEGKKDCARIAAARLLKEHRNRAIVRLGLMVAGVAAVSAGFTALLFSAGEKAPVQLPGGTGTTTAAATTGMTAVATTVPTTVTSAVSQTTSDGTSAMHTTVATTTTFERTTVTVGTTVTTAVPTTAAPYVFVPDYRDGYANTFTANSAARAAASFDNSGFLDFQDGWVYRSDGVKFRKDASGEPVRFSEESYLAGMTVIGDWVYYMTDEGVCRVRTDGRESACIVPQAGVDGEIDGFLVVDGVLYYSVVLDVGFGSYMRAYDIGSGEDTLFAQVNFALDTVVVMGEYWVNLTDGVHVFTPSERSVEHLMNYEGLKMELLDGLALEDVEWYTLLVRGDRLYTSVGDFCYNFATRTTEPIYLHEGNLEYIDKATGSKVYTRYEGLYPVDVGYLRREEGGWDDYVRLPDTLLRTGRHQRYQMDADGRVYLLSGEGGTLSVLFSCDWMGNDMTVYQ